MIFYHEQKHFCHLMDIITDFFYFGTVEITNPQKKYRKNTRASAL